MTRNAPNYVNPASLQLPSCRFSTNYGIQRLVVSMLPTRTGFERSATPSLFPSSLHKNSGKSRRLPLLDFSMPFGNDPHVVASQPRCSMPRRFPLTDRQECPVVARNPYNKSLHPIWPLVQAFACCSRGAANAWPMVQTGELNRYLGVGQILLPG
mgnify:CR=1 FL=1